MSGTLIVFFRAIAKPRPSVSSIPPSTIGRPREGVWSLMTQAAPAPASRTTNRPIVFITTSSRVTRPVWTGPAVPRWYRSSSWLAVMVSCTPGPLAGADPRPPPKPA